MTDACNSQPSHRLVDYDEALLDLLDSQRIGVIVHGPGGEILACNHTVCELMGVGRDDLVQKQLESLVLYDTTGRVRPPEEWPIAQVLATHASVRGAILGFDRPDTGERIWMDYHLEPVLDDADAIRYVVRTCMDVTQLQRASAELSERVEAAGRQKMRLTALHEVNLQLSVIADQDDLLRRAVELGQSRLGFSRCSIWLLDRSRMVMHGTFGVDEQGAIRNEHESEYVANPDELEPDYYAAGVIVHNRWPLCDAKAHVIGYGWHAAAAMLDEETVVGILCADDLLRPLESEVEQTECGEVLGLYGMTIGHLFSRLQVEQALRTSEEKLRAIFEQAPVGIAVVNEQGHPQSVNEALCRILGYNAGELRNMAFTEYTHPDDIETDWDLYRELMNGDRRLYQIEKRFIRKSGEIIHARLTVAAIQYSTEAPRFAIGIVEDITRFKQAMAELQGTLESLHTLARRLQTVREEERSHIAREVHDELAQSLTGIKLDLAWLSRHGGSAGPGVSRENLLGRVERMTTVVDSTISAVRRIASELRPPILDALGLVPALEWLAADFQNRTGILSTFTSNVEALELDKERTTAVFRTAQESLTNVIRHAHARHVTLGLAVSEAELTLTVSDDGIGISHAAIQDPHSSGLVGMRERAHLLNGRVTIASENGNGTTILLVIPLTSRRTTA